MTITSYNIAKASNLNKKRNGNNEWSDCMEGGKLGGALFTANMK